MRAYADSSALIKRSVQEAESDALEGLLDRYRRDDAVIIASSLAWVEVTRAIRTTFDTAGAGNARVDDAIESALSGIAEHPITDEVVGLARRVAPSRLRTLDALHLATAILLDVDTVITYDDRLVEACRQNGLAVRHPGRP